MTVVAKRVNTRVKKEKKKVAAKAADQGFDYDYVIVGSGFGGSVSAYRLSQKGYKVLVIEKGKWHTEQSFAKSTWNFKRWLWEPKAGFDGIMKISLFRHVSVISGVGVGGGSLVYGATLPTPKSSFFSSGSWGTLESWEEKLKPFYDEALRMLGAATNPKLTAADKLMQELAVDLGKEDAFEPSRVGVFFSDADQEGELVADPYFGGEGPSRRGCTHCASCMIGCPSNAKNSLDKNYLYLAQKLGAKVMAETEVLDVSPAGRADGKDGYLVRCKTNGWGKSPSTIYSKGVIFSGGVLGTIPLLLKLKEEGSLPALSPYLGKDIRTNNESLTAVTSLDKNANFAEGVTIGSIINTSDHSHLEPISTNGDSGAMKLMHMPRAYGGNVFTRLTSMVMDFIRHPRENFDLIFSRGFGRRTIMLLFMQHLDSTLTFKRNKLGIMTSHTEEGQEAPSASIPEAEDITDRVVRLMGGKATRAGSESVLGIPSTAHILGGAVMGKDTHHGVIDKHNRVFNYENMLVCDGSAISANPGVNPSLSITAVTEWAMSHIPDKK